MKKGHILAAVFGSLILLQGGCGIRQSIKNDNPVKERIRVCLGERYGDTFSNPVQYGGHPGASLRKYRVFAEGLKKDIAVEVYDPDGPGERIRDNYPAVKYEQQIYGKIREVIIKCFDSGYEDIAIFWSPSDIGLSDMWDEDTSLEDFIQSPAAGLSVTAAIRISDAEACEQAVRDRLTDTFSRSAMTVSGWLYFVGENMYEKPLKELSEQELASGITVPENYLIRAFFLMEKQGELSKLTISRPGKQDNDG